MRNFTVVGVYEDTLEPFVHHVRATDYLDAQREAERESNCDDLIVAGVFDGHLMSHV